jgi:hypothetical protein
MSLFIWEFFDLPKEYFYCELMSLNVMICVSNALEFHAVVSGHDESGIMLNSVNLSCSK